MLQISIYRLICCSFFRNAPQQSYYMVLPYTRNVPTHTQAIIIPQAPFTYSLRTQHAGPHALALTSSLGGGAGAAVSSHPPSQPSISYAHSTGPDASDAALGAGPSIGSLSQSFLQLRPYTAAQPSIHYAQQQLHVQPSIPYEVPSVHHQQHQQQQSIVYHQPRPLIQSTHTHYLPPSPAAVGPSLLTSGPHHPITNLDLLSPFGKQPGSLLESYVPSSVILARQRALQGRQILQPVVGTAAIIQGNHQPGYNTIAYSTYQGYTYAKRSPKAVTTTTLVTSASENVPVTVKINNSSSSSSSSTATAATATSKSDAGVIAHENN